MPTSRRLATPTIPGPPIVYAYNRSVIDDLLFLDAWENGLVPWLGAILRVRQIRRANPAVAAHTVTKCGHQPRVRGASPGKPALCGIV
jgi:hypothetical protein